MEEPNPERSKCLLFVLQEVKNTASYLLFGVDICRNTCEVKLAPLKIHVSVIVHFISLYHCLLVHLQKTFSCG